MKLLYKEVISNRDLEFDKYDLKHFDVLPKLMVMVTTEIDKNIYSLVKSEIHEIKE